MSSPFRGNRFGFALTAFATGFAAFACTPPCATQGTGTPGVAITLIDADTAAPICNATVTLSSGGYSQRLHLVEYKPDAVDAAPFRCLYGNPDSTHDGTYAVTIQAPGYPDESDSVTLSTDDCGNVFGGEKEVRLSSSD